MAHIIDIPVEFRFEVARATWRVGIAKLAGRSRAILSGALLEIVEPEEYRGLRQSVFDQRLSKPKTEPLSLGTERNVGNQEIEVVICEHPESEVSASLEALGLGRVFLPSKAERIDAWKLRDEFLRMKRSNRDLARFLNRWGVWSSATQYSSEGPVFIPADSIWLDQDAFKRALCSDAIASLSRSRLDGFEVKDKFPHFVRRVSTCRDAIDATIMFDFVQGSKFRLCALKDCRLPFKLESSHKRQFCSQYHAHLASLRRCRKLIAKSKSPTAGD